MKKVVIMAAALLLFGAGGCGYHLQGRSDRLPDDVHTLYVQMIENGTRKPFLENTVTNAVVERFSRHPRLEIVEDRNRADAILRGKIVRYGNGSVSYNRTDQIAEYRSLIVLDAALVRGDGASALWKGTVSWSEEYDTTDDKALQAIRESAAIDSASERLADELYSRIVDAF
jgi:outer membrane lipopolysaccharide assembly protein LptE/RlpB